MASLNKVLLIGHLGADPELKFLPSGQAVCDLRMATSETYRDRDEQLQERTEWHRVAVWGKAAENAAKYLRKGSQIHVEGQLRTESWEKDGERKYMVKIQAFRILYLSNFGDKGEPSASSTKGSASAPSGTRGGDRGPAPLHDPPPDGEDDIPF